MNESLKEQRKEYRNLVRVEKTGEHLSGKFYYNLMNHRYYSIYRSNFKYV